MVFISRLIYLDISKSLGTWHRSSKCVGEKGEEVYVVIDQNCNKILECG